MRLERALLLEKLEEKTPARVTYSEGSESEQSSVALCGNGVNVGGGETYDRTDYAP
jgi:hypothetical protein